MVTKDEARRNCSANLRAVIQHREMSVEDLATVLADVVPRNNVYRAVRGENTPAPHHLVSIAERLGTTVEALLGDPENFRVPRKRLAISA